MRKAASFNLSHLKLGQHRFVSRRIIIRNIPQRSHFSSLLKWQHVLEDDEIPYKLVMLLIVIISCLA